MFATRCDAGQSWDGFNSVGARAQVTWNNGSTFVFNNPGTGPVTGQANTAYLITATDGAFTIYHNV